MLDDGLLFVLVLAMDVLSFWLLDGVAFGGCLPIIGFVLLLLFARSLDFDRDCGGSIAAGYGTAAIVHR